MELKEILELLLITATVSALGLLFYFYFANELVKLWTNRIFKIVPISAILRLVSSRTKDKKGVFDTYDALVVVGRLSDHIKLIISDPSNVQFEDVEEDIFNFLNSQFLRYRNAGVRNVPEISEEALRVNVRVVFEQIKRALSEDTTRGCD